MEAKNGVLPFSTCTAKSKIGILHGRFTAFGEAGTKSSTIWMCAILWRCSARVSVQIV